MNELLDATLFAAVGFVRMAAVLAIVFAVPSVLSALQLRLRWHLHLALPFYLAVAIVAFVPAAVLLEMVLPSHARAATFPLGSLSAACFAYASLRRVAPRLRRMRPYV